MALKSYRVEVTHFVKVTLDLEKLDDQFWQEFNSTIDDRGGPDPDYIAEHVAWNHVQREDDFVEGVGSLKEMNIKVHTFDTEVDVESA